MRQARSDRGAGCGDGAVRLRRRGFTDGQVLAGMAAAQLAGEDFLVGLDRVRADQAGQLLVPVPGLATSTATGIARRFTKQSLGLGGVGFPRNWGCSRGAGGHGPALLATGVLPVRRPAPCLVPGWPMTGGLSSRERHDRGEPEAGGPGRGQDRRVLPVTPYFAWCLVPVKQSGRWGRSCGLGYCRLRARRSDSAFSRAAPRAASFLPVLKGKRGGDGRGEEEDGRGRHGGWAQW